MTACGRRTLLTCCSLLSRFVSHIYIKTKPSSSIDFKLSAFECNFRRAEGEAGGFRVTDKQPASRIY